MNNDGGYAFPVIGSLGKEENVCQEGMTLRQYYIAHAPTEPWSWFKPLMLLKPGYPECISNDGNEPSEEEYKTIADWKSDPHWDLDLPNFSKWLNALDVYYKASREWEAEYQKQRDLQWPIFWADAMIKNFE
jgi:hypothetical protein